MHLVDFNIIELIAKSTSITVGLFFAVACISLLCVLLVDLVEHVYCSKKSKILASLVSMLSATPELVVLFLCYYGTLYILKSCAGHYIDCPPFAAGLIALSIIYTGYLLPLLHGAKLAVPALQIKSAQHLGLSKAQIYLCIILPQAFQHALPGLTNLAVSLVKDTSIIYLIGGQELMGITQAEAIASGQVMWFYLVAMIIYFVLCLAIEKSMSKCMKQPVGIIK